jgi:ribosomal protein L6P/L9E
MSNWPLAFMEMVSILYLINGLVCLVVISATRGWGLNFISRRSISSTICHVVSFFKSYTMFLSNFKFGFFKPYFYMLKIKGLGFKMIGLRRRGLIFKLGFSHKVVVLKETDINIFYRFKYALIVKSRQAFLLQRWFYIIRSLKPRPVFTQKGISIKGERKRIKTSNKVK